MTLRSNTEKMIRCLPLVAFFAIIPLVSQKLQSPSQFLGFELGSQFTRHHEVVDYFKHVADAKPEEVQLISYGTTYERRPLLLAFISSKANMSRLEEIQKAHLSAIEGGTTPNVAIVWLSYNVHGNESVSTEAAMKTIYELLTNRQQWLENTVVIIDPCINPDGRDRYVNWYYENKNFPNNVDPNSAEHHEGWHTGRSNHYMFDLNRDWAWLTQKESQQRLKMYNQWMPHVHADFHEQGVDEPYYFAPAAEPYHEVITNFQRSFQETIGRNHAKYFDAEGWFYFTKEVFDLFYPSYGDTYPTYNGAIGMTYEQGGSGRAGLGIITKIGDTLTLTDRIEHHYTTGLSTVEISSQNAQKLNQEFKTFFKPKNYPYKSYVMSGNLDRLKKMSSFLENHGIKFDLTEEDLMLKGYDYQIGAERSKKMNGSKLVVSTDQTKGTLVKVLFEPDAKLSDSLTYDITAWSLPYAYGFETMATTTKVNVSKSEPLASNNSSVETGAYAHLVSWSSMEDAKFLADLYRQGIKVRASYAPFAAMGVQFERGSLIIVSSDNKNVPDFFQKLEKTALKWNRKVMPTPTGFVDSGKDFGSEYVQMIKAPKIAAISGGPTSTLRFGEIWHFFEQDLGYPLTVIDESYFSRIDLDEYDILILPDGYYGGSRLGKYLPKLKKWVASGGKLIVMGNAISAVDGEEGFAIKAKERKEAEGEPALRPHEDLERSRIKDAITGAIFKTVVDNTHPLAYGYSNSYFSLKLGSAAYEYLSNGNVVYLQGDAQPVSGFAGSEARDRIQNTLIFGVENHGGGQVIYMVDNPLFRGFWENGKLFFANALFMVN